jgi:hypothetical protein
MNPKVKTTEGKGIETHSFVHNILGVVGRAGASRCRLKRMTSK